MKSRLFVAGYACAFTLITLSTQAALTGRLPATPGGTDWQAYYDDQLYITWAANANINGSDTWNNQVAWVDGFSLGGHTDWRLPNMDVNGNGTLIQCAYADEATCRDNEYGYVYYQNGVTPTAPEPFNNLQPSPYWSGNELTATTAYVFNFDGGQQSFGEKDVTIFAWPVADGDVLSNDWSTYVPIDFSEMQNARMQDFVNGSVLPEGSMILGGLPFEIPVGGDNVWFSFYAGGPNPRILEVPVGMFGITEVHTLINTGWGLPGPTSYAYIEFIGSDGAYYSKNLIGNDDMRDYNQAGYTNIINGTTTVNVWDSGLGQRLDKQQFILPSAFHTETLNSIRLVDNGADYLQRTFLTGVTVITLPPELDIEKWTNNRQADEADDYDVPRIASGGAVNWTYEVVNSGSFAFSEAEILVTDNQPGVMPVLDVDSDDGDLILSPSEAWTYTATALAYDLTTPPPGVMVVPGCNDVRNTYENTGRVDVAGNTVYDEDTSHYCNMGDIDADGVTDSEDNCFLKPNGPLIPDAGGNIQLDTDEDGYGNICDGDLNNDGSTNTLDLNQYKQAHRSALGDANYDVDSDFNGDGVINTLDLNIYKGLHRKPPGPSCCAP